MTVFVATTCVVIGAAGVAIRGLSDQVGHADLVVVPGNTVNADGTLSPRLKGRLEAAIAAQKASGAAFIFVSGGVGREGVDEAVAMKGYLVSRGVPAEQVIQDSQGLNSAATAEHAAAVMRERGLKAAMVATQYFHVPRMRLLLQRQGVAVAGSVHASYFELRDAYSLLREVAALPVAWSL